MNCTRKRSRMPALSSTAHALAGLAVAIVSSSAFAERSYNTWRTYSGGADSAQYSALDQINKSNVSKLEVVWSFPA
ncbi:MAG TPA: hypothetical protein VFV10_20825, partial [Gammaproteobacteria bacterium]|nr:hypothetical protein [Gammaproteobacteria bacterium]